MKFTYYYMIGTNKETKNVRRMSVPNRNISRTEASDSPTYLESISDGPTDINAA